MIFTLQRYKENQDEKEYNKHLADVKEGDFLIMHIGIVKVEHIAIKPRLRIIVKGTEIFTGDTVDETIYGSRPIEIIKSNISNWMIITYDKEGYVTLMNEKGELRQDLKMKNKVKEDIEISKRNKFS